MKTAPARPSNPATFRADPRPRRRVIDVIKVLCCTATGYALFAAFDLFDTWLRFTRAHESWQLDEIPGAIIGLLAGVGWFASRRLRESTRLLNKVRQREQELCQLTAELERRVTDRTEDLERKVEAMAEVEDQLRQANKEQKQVVAELESHNREAKVLAEFSEWLQASKSSQELYDTAATLLTKLLPDTSGSLFIYANSRDLLDCAVEWNGKASPRAIGPDDCHALRKGRAYGFRSGGIDMVCPHVEAEAPEAYLCLPLAAHGETVGLLHVAFRAHVAAAGDHGHQSPLSQRQRLAAICAERISVALANVRLREQLRDQSIRDPLTGLFNRRYMLETLNRELSRVTRNGEPLALISFDVDHFKRFNDNHGHDAGDAVLRALGLLLADSVRDEDFACRWGGEEFTVVMPGATMASAMERAEALRAGAESLTVGLGPDRARLPRVTLSIGVAAFPDDGETSECLLKAADEALYRAKEAGRNQVVVAATVADPQRIRGGMRP